MLCETASLFQIVGVFCALIAHLNLKLVYFSPLLSESFKRKANLALNPLQIGCGF